MVTIIEFQVFHPTMFLPNSPNVYRYGLNYNIDGHNYNTDNH